jgi:hypothetical protein
MVDILHRVGVKTPTPQPVYDALTTVDGLAGWWTDDTSGSGAVGVLFRHQGWTEPVEFMHHCSTKWATYLMSLKSLVETGTGAPAPRDVQISDWH